LEANKRTMLLKFSLLLLLAKDSVSDDYGNSDQLPLLRGHSVQQAPLYVSSYDIARISGQDRILSASSNAFTQEGEGDAERDREEYAVHLLPFQLQVEYDDIDKMSNNDEMMLLRTTQTYLTSVLLESAPHFSRLTFYQFVRDYTDASRHFAKVAFSGIAFFSVHAMEQDAMQSEIMLSFLDKNMTSFVGLLQDSGMTHIMNATLMSIEGNEIEYQDGKVVEILDTDESIEQVSKRQMSGDMKIMTILLSLAIPGGIIFLACLVCAFRSIREVKWIQQKVDTEATIWQASSHRSYFAEQSSKELEEEKEDEEDGTGV
jgi:hypothetical protein